MTDHVRAQELAAAAIDFEIPDADRRELEAHLEGCSACQAHADGLRVDVRVLKELPRFDAPERVRRRVASEPRPSLTVRPGFAAIMASVLVVAVGLAAIGGGFPLQLETGGAPRPSDVAQASFSPSATRSAAGSAAPTPAQPSRAPATPSPRLPQTEWLAVTGQPAFDPKAITPQRDTSPPLTCDDCGDTSVLSRRSAIQAIVETPEGFIAGGHGCFGGGRVTCQADVWRSSDGLAWEVVPHDGTLDAGNDALVQDPSGMMDLAIAPRGIVAGGSVSGASGTRATLWNSSDGRSWQPIALDHDGTGQITAVAAGPTAVVAVGNVRGDEGLAAAVWVSRDGTTWESATDLAGAEVGRPHVDDQAGAGLFDVLWFNGHFVAVGADCSSADACRIAAWSSTPDGRSWTRITKVGDRGRLRSIAHVGARLVGVGDDATSEGGGAGAIWTSVNGSAWVPSGISATVDAIGPLHAVVTVGAGAIAGGEGLSLRSADGDSWTRSESDDLASGTIFDLTTGRQGVIGVGRLAGDFVGDTYESPPAVWILPYR